MTALVRSRIEDGIGILTLVDEARGNVLSADLVAQAQAVHAQFIEQGVRVAILEAEGPVFCTGRDASAVRVPGVAPAGAVFIDDIEKSPLAWVAAIDAPALGPALFLISTCMHVVAGEGARFRVPELLAGIYPRPVSAELARIFGARRTMRLLITGEDLTAQEAVAAGLVSEVVPSVEVAQKALERARAFAELDPQLLQTTREGWRTRFGTAPEKADA